MFKISPHTPAHLLIDDTPYFITAATYRKQYLLSSKVIKESLLELMEGYFQKYKWKLHHWVILDNHYHILGKSRKGEDLPSIIKGIHRASAIVIREKTGVDPPIWWNYWDYCPRSHEDYMVRLNYLLNC